MRIYRGGWPFILTLVISAAFAVSAIAQQPEPAPAPTAPARPKAKPRPPTAPAPTKPPAAVTPGVKPTLLGQYDNWGAYTASAGGKKICFVIAKPVSSETKPSDRPRNPAYMFIATRPADKVTNEISVIIGYPFKTNSEATVEVGSITFALYTQGDGAWIKNAPEEAHMIEVMRTGQTAVVRGSSTKGTQSIDTFSLKGLSQALDRSEQECK